MRPVAAYITIFSRHEMLIAGFRALIADPAGLAVCACSDAEHLRTCLRTSAPALLILDADCGVSPAFVSELKELAPASCVILWVDAVSLEFVRQAIGAGVRGVLRRNASPDLYRQCLDKVAAGQMWLEPEMSQKLLSGKTVRLSPRERQLVSLLTQGLRNKEIAWRMKITEGTTKAYLTRLFEKTGAGDRFELAMYVLQNLETGAAAMPVLPELSQ
jgi:two-component system nitrate/nitrite response regulator NarL